MARLLIMIIALLHHTRGDVSGDVVKNETRNDLNQTTQPIRNKFLQNLYKIVQNNHGIATIDEPGDQFPLEALNGIYVECILGLSFPCLQKKMINFLCRLDKINKIDLIGKSIVVVRKPQRSTDTTILAKIAEYVDPSYLKHFIDHLIDIFFDNHVLRVKIPSYFGEDSGEVDETTFVDIDFGVQRAPISSRDDQFRKSSRNHSTNYNGQPNVFVFSTYCNNVRQKNSVGSGKSRHPGHGKIRGLKKLLMLMGLLMCMKLSMMGPLMLGVIGLKAMKALILAVMSITISKMMLLGKSHLSGMLGHESSSSGGGGWDRTIQEQYTSTSSLPYHIEPPVPYNSYTVH